jgi:hypothetical protein
MAIKFFLMVNRQGQTRVAQYYEHRDVTTRAADEAEIIRKCLARTEKQVEPTWQLEHGRKGTSDIIVAVLIH